MKSNSETFDTLLESFRFKYDLHTVFDDFLTMSMCSVTRDPITGLSHYEDLYLKTIEPYREDPHRYVFPKMFAALVNEMEELKDGCNDVLGACYEKNFYKKGKQQYFTPWPICEFMARSTLQSDEKQERSKKRILEPACGSGRMLLAAAQVHGKEHFYYAVDVDHTCVKMTALNLFLNGMFNAEVMCGNFLSPNDFRISYRISLLPLGIFRIEKKEDSPLWRMLIQESSKKPTGPDLKLPSEEGNEDTYGDQLRLF